MNEREIMNKREIIFFFGIWNEWNFFWSEKGSRRGCERVREKEREDDIYIYVWR